MLPKDHKPWLKCTDGFIMNIHFKQLFGQTKSTRGPEKFVR